MVVSSVLDAKVIDNEDKHDRMPCMAPETWHSGALVVPMTGQTSGQQIVGKFSCLLEAIHALLSSKCTQPL